MSLSPQQERVAELLAAGCSIAEVKAATGYSDSYISQLGKSTDFRANLAVLKSARVEGEIARQDAYDGLEASLLNGIKERAPLADMSELSRALDVVAKNNPRRGKGVLGVNGEGAAGGVSVTLNLPTHMLQPLNLVTNSRNEVVEVDGESLLPLTQKELQSKLNSTEKI